MTLQRPSPLVIRRPPKQVGNEFPGLPDVGEGESQPGHESIASGSAGSGPLRVSIPRGGNGKDAAPPATKSLTKEEEKMLGERSVALGAARPRQSS